MELLARMTGVSFSDYICSQSTDRRNAGSVCWLWGELGRHDGWVFLSELDVISQLMYLGGRLLFARSPIAPYPHMHPQLSDKRIGTRTPCFRHHVHQTSLDSMQGIHTSP